MSQISLLVGTLVENNALYIGVEAGRLGNGIFDDGVTLLVEIHKSTLLGRRLWSRKVRQKG